MAEAAVQSPTTSSSPKYFCHKCSVSIDLSPDLPDLTCPKCESGFVEEMSQDLQAEHASSSDGSPQVLFGTDMPSLLSSFLLHSQDDRDDDSDDEDDDDDDDDEQWRSANWTSGRQMFRLPRRSRNRPWGNSSVTAEPRNAFPRFIEHLLRGLTGGGTNRTPGFLPFLPPFFHGDPRDYAWGADGLDNAITQLLNQWEGDGSPPATKDDIDALPSLAVTQEHIDKEVQCSVCMEDYHVGDMVRSLPCRHLFHGDCITPWLQLHNTCPVCRQSLGSSTLNDAASALLPDSSDSSDNDDCCCIIPPPDGAMVDVGCRLVESASSCGVEPAAAGVGIDRPVEGSERRNATTENSDRRSPRSRRGNLVVIQSTSSSSSSDYDSDL